MPLSVFYNFLFCSESDLWLKRFESRPSIRSLSQLILNAWPGMIPFSMSMYARPGVSFFNLCYCISAAFLTASQNRTSLPPSLCFVTYFNWASGGPQIYMRGSRTGWRSDIFHYCFDFFSRAKPKQKILKFLQKGILYRAPSLVITPCSYQSFICHWAVGIKIAIVFAQHLVRRRETFNTVISARSKEDYCS